MPILRIAVVAFLLLVPATASAAELTVQPCSPSVPGLATVPVQGAGFTPNQAVRLTADGRSFGSALADASGAVQGRFLAPSFALPARIVQTFELTAIDDAGVSASTPLKVTQVGARFPLRARARQRVRMKVFGFQPDRVVYLHVRRGGKTRGTFRIGRAAPPCGRASRRLRYMPLRRYSSGTYQYEFQLFKRFRPRQSLASYRVSIVRPGR